MPEWLTAARSAQETEALGELLAKTLPVPRDGPVIVYLRGELGAGKTTLARGFLKGCGFAGPVRSPTFALLHGYERSDLVVAHVDLYRLGDPRDLEGLGLRDLARPGHVWLVEWPERGEGELPAPDLTVDLTTPAKGEGRDIVTTAHSPLGAGWLRRAVEFRRAAT